MKKAILLLSVLLLIGCAARNKTKTSSTFKLDEVTAAVETIQSTDLSEARATVSDSSVSEESDIEGVYTGAADSTGKYTPAVYAKIINGDTIAKIIMSGPGSFKIREKSSSNKAAADIHSVEKKDVDYQAQSGTVVKIEAAAASKEKEVSSSGLSWTTWFWILLVLAVCLVMWWVNKRFRIFF